MSAARKRRCGGRAVYYGKNERIRTGKIRAGGGAKKSSRRNVHRAGRFGRNINRKRRRWNVRRGNAAGRAEDTSGKRAAYFYRQIRRRIYAARAYENRAERENQELCARQGRKDRKEVLRTDKNGRGKSKPRARGKRAHGRERRIVGKQVKINCFCGFFIQKRQIKA